MDRRIDGDVILREDFTGVDLPGLILRQRSGVRRSDENRKLPCRGAAVTERLRKAWIGLVKPNIGVPEARLLGIHLDRQQGN